MKGSKVSCKFTFLQNLKANLCVTGALLCDSTLSALFIHINDFSLYTVVFLLNATTVQCLGVLCLNLKPVIDREQVLCQVSIGFDHDVVKGFRQVSFNFFPIPRLLLQTKANSPHYFYSLPQTETRVNISLLTLPQLWNLWDAMHALKSWDVKSCWLCSFKVKEGSSTEVLSVETSYIHF